MEITIEQLRTFFPGLTPVLNSLLRQLHADSKILNDKDVEKIISESPNHLLVARNLKDNKIVGMAIIVIVNTLLKRKALLEELVVDENYRGNGIGKKLVNCVIDHARKEGAVFLEFTSNPKRIQANKLYEQLGFEKRYTNVYRMKI